MTVVKLKKGHLKDAIFLLKDVGAISSDGKLVYPNHVYLSNKDYDKIVKSTFLQFKKEYPNINRRQLKTSVMMHLLNFGPNQTLEKAIQPGYAIVDISSIKNEGSYNA